MGPGAAAPTVNIGGQLYTVEVRNRPVSMTQPEPTQPIAPLPGYRGEKLIEPPPTIPPTPPPSAPTIPPEPLPAWSYDPLSANGPQAWPKMFGAASRLGECDGQQQSPINIVSSIARQEKMSGWVPLFSAVPSLEVINDGHSIAVVGASLSRDSSLFHGKPYALKRLTIKKPSESQINGMQFPLEMQFEHADTEGNALIVSLLFREGVHNEALDALDWPHLPKTNGSSHAIASFSPGTLLPLGANRNFWHYRGSLSSPPCTEGAAWVVVGVHPSIAHSQLATVPISGNTRPVQPMNGRGTSFLTSDGDAVRPAKHDDKVVAALGSELHSITDMKALLKRRESTKSIVNSKVAGALKDA